MFYSYHNSSPFSLCVCWLLSVLLNISNIFVIHFYFWQKIYKRNLLFRSWTFFINKKDQCYKWMHMLAQLTAWLFMTQVKIYLTLRVRGFWVLLECGGAKPMPLGCTALCRPMRGLISLSKLSAAQLWPHPHWAYL